MSGHSKWSTIKRQKGANDAKRSQLFTKLAREITIAARQGEPDPQTNPTLRLAVQKAKDNNMPTDNIDRAIKRASGPSEAAQLNKVVLEGYGPGGSAILLHALTDNRNRTISEVRSVFNRNAANIGESGCVNWMFEPKGVIVVSAGNIDTEELALIAIDVGADDFKIDVKTIEIYTNPQDLEVVRNALEKRGVIIESAELSQIPKTMINLDEDSALQILKLMDKLEDLDDVQHVYTNADFPDEVLDKYQG